MSSTKKSILLVEDEALIAMMEKKELEKYGYAVQTATSGEKAVQAVLKDDASVDLILMDIDLGNRMDGIETAEKILKEKEIPIVFLSSHIEPEVVAKTERITSYGYVVKDSGIVVLDASIKMAFKLFEEKQEVNRNRNYLEKMGILAKIGTWEYHLRNAELSWSKEVYKIYEMPDSIKIDLDGLLKFYTDKSTDEMSRAINLAVKEGKPFIRDAEITTAKGTRKRVRTQGQILHDETTGADTIFGTIQDISEIRLLDLVSQESEMTLNQVEQITHIGHWSVNMIDGAFFHSDEIKRIFGYEPAEYALSVEEAINAYHPDDRDEVIRLFNRAAETGEGYEFDLRLIQPDDSIRNVHSIGYTQQDADGKVTRVYGIFQDITEQKRTEAALQKSNEELNESLALFHDLVETSQDLIWQADASGRFTYLNPAWKDVLGYELDAILGHPFSDFMTAKQAVQDVEAFKESMSGVTVTGHESVYLHHDGHEVPLIFNAKTIHADDGTVAGARGAAFDMTKRLKAEKQIKRQLHEKEILLKEVHHRIKNNINTVKSLLSIQIGLTDNDEAKSILADAVSRMESMHQIYVKMLISDDYQELSVKSYLEGLLESIIGIFPEKKRISLQTELDDFPLGIKHLFPIGAIVNELVTNTIKYAFDGTDANNVIISLKRDNGNALLTIHDNGTGIPENFDPANAGTGMMLVNMLAEQLDGTFNIVRNSGTRATVTFPV